MSAMTAALVDFVAVTKWLYRFSSCTWIQVFCSSPRSPWWRVSSFQSLGFPSGADRSCRWRDTWDACPTVQIRDLLHRQCLRVQPKTQRGRHFLRPRYIRATGFRVCRVLTSHFLSVYYCSWPSVCSQFEIQGASKVHVTFQELLSHELPTVAWLNWYHLKAKSVQFSSVNLILINSVDDLKTRITEVLATIDNAMLGRVWQKSDSRLDVWRVTCGVWRSHWTPVKPCIQTWKY